MRVFLPCLILELLFTTVCWTALPDKPVAEPASSSPSRAGTEKLWKICRFSLSKEGAIVWLKETGTPKSLILKSADDGDNRLLSVNFTSVTDELQAEVLIAGERFTLVQKASDMEPSTSASPTMEDRARYESLSPKGREKFRSKMREKFSDPEFRNSTESARRAFIDSLFETVSKEDQAEAAAKRSKERMDEAAPPEKAERADETSR